MLTWLPAARHPRCAVTSKEGSGSWGGGPGPACRHAAPPLQPHSGPCSGVVLGFSQHDSLSVSPFLSRPGQLSGQHGCPLLPTPEPSPRRRSRRALEGLGVVTSAWEAGCAAQGPGREDRPPRGEAGAPRPFSAVQLTCMGTGLGPLTPTSTASYPLQ